MKEGPGTLYLSNSEYFVGMFEADMVSGDGVYHSMSEGNIRATWRNNKILQDDWPYEVLRMYANHIFLA